MGRPRKYNTPEEKRLADCAKSARYHTKNRKKINRKRRRDRARAKPLTEEEGRSPNETTKARKRTQAAKPPQAQTQVPKPLTRIEILLQRVESIKTHLQDTMKGKTDKDYLSSLCRQFVDIYPQDYPRAAAVIEDEGDKLEAIKTSLNEYGGEILSLVGYSDKYQVYERIQKHLSVLISSVAHLNGDAFVPEQLVEDFHAGRLPFQQ